MEQVSVLSQITVYPVKSVAGIDMSTSWVELQGLSFDRRFMLALPDGKMVTARQYPQMVKITASLQADGIIFSYPDKSPLMLKYRDLQQQQAQATVWNDSFTAYTTTEQANLWFSEIIQQPVSLLYSGEQSNRVREKLGHNVSFADGYPMLLISQGSLNELNRRSSDNHSMKQFRPNLVVNSDEPFVEDTWKRIKIGEVEFEVVKPCERCILTTVDTTTAKFRTNKEPLATLSRFRANPQGAVFFGQNLVAKNEGVIKLDDVVEVLEYQQPHRYPDQGISKDLSNQSESGQSQIKSVVITANGVAVAGDNQSNLLEQLESAGLSIPYKCRSGMCGTCSVILESGSVDQDEVPAATRARQKGLDSRTIFACCAVPNQDIEIRY
ncbi:putative protein YcbX [Vibrio hippocampi]|uniref:(2Fe-2S)-binding protein n=1 Tax=Vibrio hippocampi TaxID=654686 RepID=A0ABM8ZNA2_9VIBR|nr:putative protein YcbX [Vibrio hippocampi]